MCTLFGLIRMNSCTVKHSIFAILCYFTRVLVHLGSWLSHSQIFSKQKTCSGPSRGRGKVFPGPATFGGQRHLFKATEKDVPDGFFLASNRPMHNSIFRRGSAPEPAGGAYNAPQTPSRMVSRHPPHVSSRVSISAPTE